jgi:hypothetical protein
VVRFVNAQSADSIFYSIFHRFTWNGKPDSVLHKQLDDGDGPGDAAL